PGGEHRRRPGRRREWPDRRSAEAALRRAQRGALPRLVAPAPGRHPRPRPARAALRRPQDGADPPRSAPPRRRRQGLPPRRRPRRLSAQIGAGALPYQDAELEPEVALAVAVEEEALAAAVQIEIAEDLHVAPAVLLDQVEAPLLHPLQALQPVGGFAQPQGLLGQMP